MTNATVQILPLDTVSVNGRIYPRPVVEKALANFKRDSILVVHQHAFLSTNGAPTENEALGAGTNLRIDDTTNMVLADVRIDKVPDEFLDGYVLTMAGHGIVLGGGEVSDYTITSIIMSKR